MSTELGTSCKGADAIEPIEEVGVNQQDQLN